MDQSYDLIQRIRGVEESVKSAHKRIDDISNAQKALHELAATVKVLSERVGNIKADTEEINARLTQIETTPRRRWETIVGAILGAIAGGLAATIINFFVG